MSGRVIIGEAIWSSKKIAALEPAWIRPEYTWIYSIAGPNGVFEVDPRAIWAKCYAFGRPDKSVDDVDQILRTFENAGLLFVWEDNGKRLGYWTNSDKPGRCPRPAWLKRYAKQGKLEPAPPQEALKTYLETVAARNGHADGVQPARPQHATGVPCFDLSCIDLSKPSCADKSGLHENDVSSLQGKNHREDELPTIEGLWDYYLVALGKNSKILKLTAKRIKKGAARLRECLGKTDGDLAKAESLMKIAIDNLAASDYHREHGYDSWEENLFPNAEKLEWWLDRPEKATGAAS